MDNEEYKPLSAIIEYLKEEHVYPSLNNPADPDEEIDPENCNSDGGESIRNALNVGILGGWSTESEPDLLYEWEKRSPVADEERDAICSC